MQHHRQPAISVFPRFGRHPRHHFLLQHKVQIVEVFSLGQQMKQQGCGDVVGQVAGHAQPGAGAAQCGEIKIQRVGMMNPQSADACAARPQRLQQIAVQFHDIQLTCHRQQWNRQCPQPGADFHQPFARRRPDRRDDAGDDARITQKMLTKPLAGLVVE